MYFLLRYGSGEYKIYLNDAGLAASKDPDLESRNLCKALFSVWDSAYPPILDPSRADKGLGILDWKHPANASYVAELRTKGINPPGERNEEDVPNDVVKTLVDKVGTLADKVANQEQDRLVDRIAEKINPNGGASAASGIIDVMRAAKELNPTPPPPAPDTSFATTIQLFNTLMTMKADNPMGEMYKDEMRALRDEMKTERDENRKLQAELRQTANVKTGFNLEDLIDKSDAWMPKLKALLNLGGDKLTEIAHGRPRQWWQELLLDIAPPLISNLAPTIPMMIGAFTAPAIRPAANGMNGQQQPQAPAALPAGQPAQTNPMQALQMKVGGFLGANIKPVGKFFEDFVSGKLTDPSDPESKTDGVDFAMWVCDYHGEEILKDARALGSAQIMQMFRQSPYWIHMQKNEAKLAEFLDQALQYSPEAEPEPEGPIDLSGGQDA
jgi:hypothetical protein